MGPIMTKPTFCICENENKGADQLRSNCEVTAKLINAFVFATRIVLFLFFLNLKFPASSLLRLYRQVSIRHVWKPHFWFSHDTAQIEMVQELSDESLLMFNFFPHFFFSLESPQNDITIDTTIIDSNSEKEKLLIDVMLLMIQYLKGQAVERIQKRFPDLEMKDFYWVITVPALWSDQTVVMYRDLIIEVR